MKLETHLHTFGTSSCATTPNEEIIKFYKNAGYQGIVVANHLYKGVYDNYLKGNSHTEKMDSYFKAFEDFKSLCAKSGLKAFLGAEVCVVDDRKPSGTEYIVLGFDKDIFYKENLNNLSQKELFETINKQKGFMYQSHPFRTGVCLGNPLYMHGAESFNGHYHHKNNNDLALEFCNKNSLIKMSGTDFHHEDQPITAGIIVPDSVENERDLVSLIFSGNYSLIENKELYAKEYNNYASKK